MPLFKIALLRAALVISAFVFFSGLFAFVGVVSFSLLTGTCWIFPDNFLGGLLGALFFLTGTLSYGIGGLGFDGILTAFPAVMVIAIIPSLVAAPIPSWKVRMTATLLVTSLCLAACFSIHPRAGGLYELPTPFRTVRGWTISMTLGASSMCLLAFIAPILASSPDNPLRRLKTYLLIGPLLSGMVLLVRPHLVPEEYKDAPEAMLAVTAFHWGWYGCAAVRKSGAASSGRPPRSSTYSKS